MFGNNASADTNFLSQNSSEANSQNVDLPQVTVSPATIIQDKKDKNNKGKTTNDTKDINIVSDNALAPTTGLAEVSDGADNTDLSSDDISVYVVRQGDTISEVANMFGVTANTIRWANDLKVGEKPSPGDVWIILPVTGVKITVAKGDTLKSLAKKYSADVSDIADFNGIAEDAQLAIGDELIIPDGEMSDEGGNVPIKSSNNGNKNYDISNLAKVTGYFMNPVPGAILTQGLHDLGRAVDLAISRGTPIHAAASGTVIFARMGSNGGYGGLVIINHPNGTETLYAHRSKIATSAGEQVSQGEVIGYVGSTGHSTGPHVHFEVRGPVLNPGAYIPIGSTVNADWK